MLISAFLDRLRMLFGFTHKADWNRLAAGLIGDSFSVLHAPRPLSEMPCEPETQFLDDIAILNHNGVLAGGLDLEPGLLE